MILPALQEAESPYWRPIKYSLFPPLGLATLASLCDEDDEIEVLLSEDQLSYVENSGVNDTFEYFYLRQSNDLFRLNKQTGVITSVDCPLNNNNTTIQWIKASGDMLLIEKAAAVDSTDTHDYWYMVPGENLKPKEGELPNEANEDDGFVEAGKVYVEVVN